MGYTLTVLRLDFRFLLSVPGSRNETLMNQILPVLLDEDPSYQADWEEEAAEDSEPGTLVLPSEALRQLFAGTVPVDETYGVPYISALVALYSQLGVEVGEINFSSHEMRLLSDWDEAMVQAGMPHSFFSLSGRGAPFPFPPDEPFPTVGFMTPEEVSTAHDSMQGRPEWPRFWRRIAPEPQMDRPTYEMFREWVGAARGRSQGLVGILA